VSDATDTRSTIKEASIRRKFMVVRSVLLALFGFDCDVSQRIDRKGKQLNELKIEVVK
jgi:hypothetical protein